jgi:polyferredoxin
MLAADEGSPLPFVARWEALERAHRREIRRKRLLIAALWALFMALVGIAQVWPSHAATASAFLSGGALLGVSLRRLLP